MGILKGKGIYGSPFEFFHPPWDTEGTMFVALPGESKDCGLDIENCKIIVEFLIEHINKHGGSV